MQWAPVNDTACPSPAAGGSTSLSHPGPGSLVPSSPQHWWDLDCAIPQWPYRPKHPKTLVKRGWGGGRTQQSINITTTENIHFLHNGCEIVLSDLNKSILFGRTPETVLLCTVNKTLMRRQIPSHRIWCNSPLCYKLSRVEKFLRGSFSVVVVFWKPHEERACAKTLSSLKIIILCTGGLETWELE